MYDGKVHPVDLKSEEAYLLPLNDDNDASSVVTLERGVHIAVDVGRGQYREGTVTASRSSPNGCTKYRVHYHATCSNAWISTEQKLWVLPPSNDSAAREDDESSSGTTGRTRKRRRVD